MKTMQDKYNDGSSCIVCDECGLCIDCGDCGEYGCGKNTRSTTEKIMNFVKRKYTTDCLGIFDFMRAFSTVRPRQEGYYWSVLDRILLLDSINKGYPIGNILTWKSSEKYNCFSHVDSRYASGSYCYIIDGSERVSIVTDTMAGVEEVWYDPAHNEFKYCAKKPEEWYFAMCKLMNTFEYLPEVERIRSSCSNGELYANNVQEMFQRFTSYSFVIIEFSEIDDVEAMNIKNRANR